MLKINKQLQRAIEEKYPLEWEYDLTSLAHRTTQDGYALYAWTGHAETGHKYRRRVYKSVNIATAVEMHGQLAAAGTRVSNTPEDVLHINDYGWRGVMELKNKSNKKRS